MKITRSQLRRLILKETQDMSVATLPGHPNPRSHEIPDYQNGPVFAARRQPMGRGYGRIAKDFVFYIQTDMGESVRIPHQMHRPVTTKRDAKGLVDLLAATFPVPINSQTAADISAVIASSPYRNELYY